MPVVFASPGLKWEGFGPQAYVLDDEKVWDLPITNELTGESTTIGKVVLAFRDQKVEVDHPAVNLKLKSDSQEIVVRGPQIHSGVDANANPFTIRAALTNFGQRF